jgi:hypothetical protein
MYLPIIGKDILGIRVDCETHVYGSYVEIRVIVLGKVRLYRQVFIGLYGTTRLIR